MYGEIKCNIKYKNTKLTTKIIYIVNRSRLNRQYDEKDNENPSLQKVHFHWNMKTKITHYMKQEKSYNYNNTSSFNTQVVYRKY